MKIANRKICKNYSRHNLLHVSQFVQDSQLAASLLKSESKEFVNKKKINPTIIIDNLNVVFLF